MDVILASLHIEDYCRRAKNDSKMAIVGRAYSVMKRYVVVEERRHDNGALWHRSVTTLRNKVVLRIMCDSM